MLQSIFVRELTAMGFSDNAATRACQATHDCGLEPALDWLVAHLEDADLNEPTPLQARRPASAQPLRLRSVPVAAAAVDSFPAYSACLWGCDVLP